MANMEKIADKLAILPAQPGCYLMKDEAGTIIYVGKAKKLKNRVRQYFVGAHDFKTTRLVANIDDFEFIVTGSEKEALLLEINLIKKYTPQYNIMFMDDKTYPYLKLTKGKAPMLKVVRNLSDKNAEYFGPFPESHKAYQTMQLLNRLYPLRKCATLPKKPCLYYHLQQCLAPCIQTIDDTIYQKMIADIRKFLKGDVKEIIDRLQKEMEEAVTDLAFEKAQEKKELIDSILHVTSAQQIDFKDRKDRDAFHYYVDKGYISIQGFLVRDGKIQGRIHMMKPLYDEAEDVFLSFVSQYYASHPLPSQVLLPPQLDVEALNEVLEKRIYQPLRGDKRKLLDMVEQNAKTAHAQKFELSKRKSDEKEAALKQLDEIMGKKIRRIELFDNSHISGSFNVSGMVVYVDGEPSKKDYRLFKLQGYRSDLDSMKEAIYRRYFRVLKEGGNFADLLIVDGGYLQIEAAKEILDALEVPILLYGLVKDDRHSTNALMDRNGTRIPIAKDSPLFFLLTRMQDEVHRFAISYHRKVRGKAMTRSILDEVEGIGEVRKKALFKRFHSLKGLKQASIEQLQEVLPEKVANNVYEVLQHPERNEDACIE